MAYTTLRPLAAFAVMACLSACGGGDGDDAQGSLVNGGSGGGGGFNSGGNGSSNGYQQGIFPARATLAAKCATPRTGNDLFGDPFPDTAGTAMDEKMWLRSWTNDIYLWYREVPDLNPASYTVDDYFQLLKTPASTPSGAAKDQFHFAIPTDDYQRSAFGGVSAGYGVQYLITEGGSREIYILYVEPGSPAEAADLDRGDRITQVDGVNVTLNDNASIDTLNAGLFPTELNQSHTFTVQDRGVANATHPVTVTSAEVESSPVLDVRTINTGPGNNDVGYILFNDHIATAEQALIDAITTLAAQNIDDLVLDLRYNGGGFLDIASELAYMIAGSANTANKTFEQLQFNDKYPTTDPVLNVPLTPVPFHTTTQGFSSGPQQNLPTLNLSRVYVLTGPNTCSASESIMNSLRGADVEVIQIGSTTCGKPYGFYDFDNCGTTYFSIQFQGVNNKDFGDYPDGFSPVNSPDAASVDLPGCSVADDLSHDLGDPNEARLKEALAYRAGGACITSPSGVSAKQALTTGAGSKIVAVEGTIRKAPWLQNRILRK